MQELSKKELLTYEAPWYTELISFDWLQTIIARRLANKVNKKYQRYMMRKQREHFINKIREGLNKELNK